MISVCGVVLATIALVCTLSVYNGFNDLVSTLFSTFDPELKITPQKGKTFSPHMDLFNQIRNNPSIDIFAEIVEDHALVKFKDRQVVATIKGVPKNFNKLTAIDSILIDGEFELRNNASSDYAVLGVGLSASLGAGAAFVTPLELFAPKRFGKVNLANPSNSFNKRYAQVGAVFAINQPAYDENYMLVSLPLARELFDCHEEVTSIELKLEDEADLEKVKAEIIALIGSDYYVKDRFEQQEASFKMMQIEKWMTYLILSFILTIALFNVVGSLSMLMIEKRQDVETLHNLGADNRLIAKIFLIEGWLISGTGAIIGLVVGIALCLIQQHYGIISLGQTAGAFIIDAYPVRLVGGDLITIFITVLTVGFFAAWYPVQYLSKRWLEKN
jgi:lipoprotein-releasing system permease protein/zinc transport system substrate-binding protein